MPEPTSATDRPTRWRYALPALLVLVAFAPRLLRAWQLESLSPDGVFYVETAQALERGDWHAAFHELHLNTFPLILVGLHRLGFAWETAAMGWNVLASSLVVLPLYGWMKHQGNERWALLGSLLYACHGEFIEQSPEAIREPTFWLLSATSLYASARAAGSANGWWTLAAMALVALATLTRVEGALFILPLVMWSWAGTPVEMRGRMAAKWLGGAVSLLLAWLCLQVFWMNSHGTLEGMRTTPLRIAARWLDTAAQSCGLGASSLAPSGAELPNLPQQRSLAERGRILATTFRAGLTPVFAVVLALGLWLRRRELMSRREGPLVLVALGVTAGIWMHLWYDEESSSRYVLTIALIGLPTGACACDRVSQWLVRFCQPRVPYARFISVAALLAVFVIGCVDALWNGPDPLRSRRQLATWVGETYGPNATVVGTVDVTRLVGYYAPAHVLTLPKNTSAKDLLRVVQNQHPQVVLIHRDRLPESVYESLVENSESLCLEPLDAAQFAPGYERLLILAAPLSPRAVATLPRARR